MIRNVIYSANGSLGGSSLAVDSGAALSGSGTVNAPTNVAGSLRPGNSPGILEFSDGLTLENDSTLEIEIIADMAAGRGTNYDAVDVTGGTLVVEPSAILALIFNASGSTVDFTDEFWAANQSWLLFDNANTPTVGDGVFGQVTTTVDSLGQNFSVTGGSISLSEVGDDIQLNYVIPEPEAYALFLGIVSVGLLFLRRRRLG